MMLSSNQKGVEEDGFNTTTRNSDRVLHTGEASWGRIYDTAANKIPTADKDMWCCWCSCQAVTTSAQDTHEAMTDIQRTRVLLDCVRPMKAWCCIRTLMEMMTR
mmetsp:Transcript_3990/g.6681  ORF Transcript_3990/g.6681 Transcript_3990/m.6681 type:complete len:104 (-) Transcript_3990:219-530(-)